MKPEDKMLDLDDPKTQQALKEWVQSLLDQKKLSDKKQ